MNLAPERKIIRFGLGRSGHVLSPLWRMWIQGDETYLAVRTFSGVSKVSLHSTGHWVLTAGTSSILIKGPRVLAENWTVGPRVVFAGVPATLPLEPVGERTTKPVCLFEPPPQGHWRDFAVLFSARPPDPEVGPQFLPAGSEVVGPLVRRSGGGVCLATFTTPMTDEQVEYVGAERAKFRVFVKRDVDALRSALAVLVVDASNGDTMLISLCLGRENIVLADA
jgi:hypothetical protein